MYLDHFGLSDFPFIQSGKDELFFVTPPARKHIVRIQHWLDCGHDLLLVTGPVGCGREALVHHALNDSVYAIQSVTVSGLTLSDTDFLHYLALELGVNTSGEDLMSLRHAIKAHLKRTASDTTRACVVILEAEKLPASQLALLQDISRAADFYLPLCSVILIGNRSMAKTLGSSLDASKRSPVSLPLVLKPLTLAMTKEYLSYRLNLVSIEDMDITNTIFSDAVIDQIYEQTAGNLAVINRLADTLLMAAWAQGSSSIQPKHVTEAARLLGGNTRTKPRPKSTRTSIALTGRARTNNRFPGTLANIPAEVHPLDGNVTTIGRAADCNIRIEGKDISPCQALIVKTSDGMFIRNEGANVPLFLNSAKVDSSALKKGDILRIGDHELSMTTSSDGVPVLVSNDRQEAAPVEGIPS